MTIARVRIKLYSKHACSLIVVVFCVPNPFHDTLRSSQFDLKGQLMTATERPEFLMQLGAYMQRGGWNKTAQVLITMAANNCKDRDFQILYSAGEYFHNVVEDVQRAAGHFFACAEASLNMVKKSATPKDVKKEAMEKLKIVAGLVPERGEQSLIIEALIDSKMWRETREVSKGGQGEEE